MLQSLLKIKMLRCSYTEFSFYCQSINEFYVYFNSVLHLSRKIPDWESDEWRIWNVFLRDLVGTFQEESFVGGHLVEHNLLNWRFATPGNGNALFFKVTIPTTLLCGFKMMRFNFYVLQPAFSEFKWDFVIFVWYQAFLFIIPVCLS
jgi:hypothetical protein